MDIHKDIIDSYQNYKKDFRTNNKWATAEAFTKKILDYAINEDLMFSKEWNNLVYKLVELNEQTGSKKTPYTAEKPNFAILISIVKNFVEYSKEYGIEFLQDLLMRFEEAAFTGVFGIDGGINLEKYYRVVYRFLKMYLGIRFSNSELGNISNTLVHMFLGETGKDLASKNKKRSLETSVDNQSRNTKKRRAEGMRKKMTRNKKKYKKSRKKKSRKKKSRKKKSRKNLKTKKGKHYKK